MKLSLIHIYHDTYEIYLQTKGERYIFLENICHAMKPGDVCIIRPFDLHYGERCV